MAKTKYRVVIDEKAKRGMEFRGANRELISFRGQEVINSGCADSGKTVSACTKIHLICSRYAGAQGGMTRKTFKSIAGTCGRTFENIIRGAGVETIGGKKPERYIYPNGSTVWVGGMDNPDSVLSAERDFIYVNQAEELTLNEWEILSTRTSGRGAVIRNPQLFGDCNPGGSKHWIRMRAKAGSLKLLIATHKDNPTIYHADGTLTKAGEKIGSMILKVGGAERLAALEKLTGVRRKRLLEGIWATSEGAVFDMFDSTPGSWGKEWTPGHVLIRDAKEMKNWYLAMDDGFTNPAVILLIGEDSDKRWHIFREYYQAGVVQETVIKEAKRWAENIRYAGITLGYKPGGIPINAPVSLVAVDEAAASLIAGLKNVGLNAVAGKGRIEDGNRLTQNRLNKQGDGFPRLTVDPSCVDTINEFESHVFKEGTDKPVDAYNHCFISETPILTKRGMKPISEIFKGDYVWSPFGWNKVIRAGCGGIKKVKNYGVFTCTPDHKILTTRGLIEVDSLRYFDKILAWQNPRKWSGEELFFAVIQNQRTEILHFIFDALLIKRLAAERVTCIVLYGNTIAGKFHRIRKSITLIITLLITALIILSLSLTLNTLKNIIGAFGRVQKSILKSFIQNSERRQTSGQPAKKAKNNYEQEQKNYGKPKNGLKENATLAKKDTKLPSLIEAGSVISIAKCGRCEKEETHRSKNTNHTATETLAPIYNLDTEYGCYFANGILVSNSIAAIRYLEDALNEPGSFRSTEGMTLGSKQTFTPDLLTADDLDLGLELL